MRSSLSPIARHLLTTSPRHLSAVHSVAATSNKSSPARFTFHNKEAKEEEEDDVYDTAQSISNRSYWSKKIHALCSTPDSVDSAFHLLDRLRHRGFLPDSLNISSIIHGLCGAGRSDEAHQRLLLSFAYGLIPDDRTANVLLARLLDASTPRLTLAVLRQLFLAKSTFVPSLTNYNRLIHQLCAESDPVEGHRLLLDMIARSRYPNVVTYTTLVNGFGRIGRLDDARQLFEEMLSKNVRPNPLTYSVLIRWVLRKRRVGEGKELMARLWLRMQDEEDSSINSAAFANLIDSLCLEGFFHEVFRIAEEMPQGKWVCEEFAYGQMMDSLCKAGRHHGASRIVYIMKKRGFFPGLVSYNSIIHGLSMGNGCMRAYQLFKEGIAFRYSPFEPTYKVLVEALCKEKELQKAKYLVEFMLEIEGVNKTRIHNIFLSALRVMDNPSEQLNVLVSMLQKHCHPDAVSLNTVIHGFCKIGRVNEAMRILDDMLKGKFCSPDVVTFTTAICGLLDVGRYEEALNLLHKEMPEHSCAPNIVTYNIVLRGLFRLGKVDEPREIFHEMESKGVTADCTTHAVIIEGLCEAGQLEQAKKHWDEIVWPSNMHDDHVYAAIMRGLCRSGKLDVACDFLYELVDCGVSPGLINYNILIDGSCKQGLKRKAYQIVGEMRKNGVKPDAVTWRILDKLHDKESTELVPSRNCIAGANGAEEVSTTSRKLKLEEEECINKNDGELGDQVSLVNRSLSTAFSEENHIDNALNGSFSQIKVVEQKQEDPLSRIARRVFGLL